MREIGLHPPGGTRIHHSDEELAELHEWFSTHEAALVRLMVRACKQRCDAALRLMKADYARDEASINGIIAVDDFLTNRLLEVDSFGPAIRMLLITCDPWSFTVTEVGSPIITGTWQTAALSHWDGADATESPHALLLAVEDSDDVESLRTMGITGTLRNALRRRGVRWACDPTELNPPFCCSHGIEEATARCFFSCLECGLPACAGCPCSQWSGCSLRKDIRCADHKCGLMGFGIGRSPDGTMLTTRLRGAERRFLVPMNVSPAEFAKAIGIEGHTIRGCVGPPGLRNVATYPRAGQTIRRRRYATSDSDSAASAPSEE